MQRTVRVATLLIGGLLAAAGTAGEVNPLTAHAAAGEPIARIVFRLRTPSPTELAAPAAAESRRPVDERLQAVAGRTGVSLHLAYSLTGEIHVARLLLTERGGELAATLAALRADPAIEYADPDRRRYIHSGAGAVTPNDPLFAATGGATGQWYLGAPSVTPSGTSLAAVNAVVTTNRVVKRRRGNEGRIGMETGMGDGIAESLGLDAITSSPAPVLPVRDA